MLKGDPGAYFHPYWSPLLPALVALTMKLTSPFHVPALLLAHGVIAISAIAGLACFAFFAAEWRYLLQSKIENVSRVADVSRVLFGLALYLFAVIKLIGAEVVSPDIPVMAIVLALAGTSCRLASGRGGWRSAIGLGFLLAAGYFTKAALLPLGLLLVLLMALLWFRGRARRRYILVALLVYAAVAGAYIGILSARQHRLTFGESGRLNYAWSVLGNAPMYAGWTQGSEASGAPVHPLQVLGWHPAIFAFGNTTPGTVPLWYDPSYFYQGLKFHFSLRMQIRQLLRVPGQLAGPMRGSAFAILLVLILLSVPVILHDLKRKPFGMPKLGASWLMAWAVGAYCMYSLVSMKPRYVAPFFVLLVYLVAEELYTRLPLGAVRLGGGVLLAGTILLCADLVVSQTVRRQLIPPGNSGKTQQVVADNLKEMGVSSGEKIAVLADPFDVYYAFLDHLHVVVTIGFKGGNQSGNASEFWAMDAASREELESKLASLGVVAIVSPSPCNAVAGPGWREVGSHEYCALRISR